jgi:hypothetical protein
MDDGYPDNSDDRQLWERFSRGRRSAGACPTELELAEYADGRASEPRRERVEAHLALCAECVDQVVAGMEDGLKPALRTQDVPWLVVARAQALVASRGQRPWRAAAGWAAAAAASLALGFAGLRAGAETRGRGHSGSVVASEVAFEAPAQYRDLLSTTDVLGALASGTQEGHNE